MALNTPLAANDSSKETKATLEWETEDESDLSIFFCTALSQKTAADLAGPLIRYLKLTEERRELLLQCPDLAAAVMQFVHSDPQSAMRLGLV